MDFVVETTPKPQTIVLSGDVPSQVTIIDLINGIVNTTFPDGSEEKKVKDFLLSAPPVGYTAKVYAPLTVNFQAV